MPQKLIGEFSSIAESLISESSNRYVLSISQLTSPLSVFSIKADEQLSKPWRYEITFTSTDKRIDVSSVLSQSASFSFLPQSATQMLMQISSLDRPATQRTLYGVITEFSQLSVSKDQAHYRVVLQPRLALFANDRSSEIYQNQSVVAVVEEVLRRHGFTGG